MIQQQLAKNILLGYSRLLEYPKEDMPDIAEEIKNQLSKEFPELSENIQKFLDYIETVPFSRMEELYSSNFDISPACYIYAGHQLFGEGFKRSEFIIGLKEKFREYDFDWGNELPDHFSVLIKFLAEIELFEDTAKDMINDCLLPSMKKMIKGLTRKDTDQQNPFWYVLISLENFLVKCVEEFKQKEITQ